MSFRHPNALHRTKCTRKWGQDITWRWLPRRSRVVGNVCCSLFRVGESHRIASPILGVRLVSIGHNMSGYYVYDGVTGLREDPGLLQGGLG